MGQYLTVSRAATSKKIFVAKIGAEMIFSTLKLSSNHSSLLVYHIFPWIPFKSKSVIFLFEKVVVQVASIPVHEIQQLFVGIKICHGFRVQINISWFVKYNPFFNFHNAIFRTQSKSHNTKVQSSFLFLNRETKLFLFCC